MEKILELEDKINSIVFKDNGRICHFSYNREGDKFLVSAMTYNSNNRESFLLKKMKGNSYEECLSLILDYIIKSRKTMKSYTVNWFRKGKFENNISYFYCNDIIEVLEKFYEGKDKLLYEILEIKMNPIS